jgi:hypothetical protein
MTAVTAAVPPAPAPTSSGAVGTDTVTWAQFTQSINQAQRTSLCVRPIRLRGQIAAIDLATGELRSIYDTTADEPGGVLHVPCGNRRETICPPCSTVYKRDARQLVRAGLTGGKGIPETITSHPCVFATFTAPSFGPVHARRMRGKTVLPCRPRRDHKVRRCPHGRDISCPVRHSEHDPRLGRALCPDCYDYQAAVLFNAYAGDLWRRFTTYLPRHLARLTGLTQKRLRALVRVRYVKVAEYQARGVIHFHAVIRLDRAPDVGGEHLYDPPDPHFTTDLLCDAIATPPLRSPSRSARTSTRPGPCSRCGSAPKSIPSRSLAATGCPAPVASCRSRRSATTSPNTPPRPSTPPACRNSRSALPKTSPPCGATATTGT